MTRQEEQEYKDLLDIIGKVEKQFPGRPAWNFIPNIVTRFNFLLQLKAYEHCK